MKKVDIGIDADIEYIEGKWESWLHRIRASESWPFWGKEVWAEELKGALVD